MPGLEAESRIDPDGELPHSLACPVVRSRKQTAEQTVELLYGKGQTVERQVTGPEAFPDVDRLRPPQNRRRNDGQHVVVRICELMFSQLENGRAVQRKPTGTDEVQEGGLFLIPRQGIAFGHNVTSSF